MQNPLQMLRHLLRRRAQGSRISTLLREFDSCLWGNAKFVCLRTSAQGRPLFVLLCYHSNDRGDNLQRIKLIQEDEYKTLLSLSQSTLAPLLPLHVFSGSPTSDEVQGYVLSALKVT